MGRNPRGRETVKGDSFESSDGAGMLVRMGKVGGAML